MVVRLDNIRKAFASGFLMKRKAVLRGVSLGIHAGDAYALLGANGAGKSTTLRILLGLTRADAGEGRLFGRPLDDRVVHARLGYLPENPSFHEQLTAREFLSYCGKLVGLRSAALSRRVDELLERVRLEDARNIRLRKMSKGMLQRLGLAQVLLADPELLVLDEPMSGLDPPGRKLVRDLIVEQRDAGKTVLFSTHILSDAEVVCTRAGILRGGLVVRELSLEELGRLQSESVEVEVSGLPDALVRQLQTRARSVIHAAGSVLFTVAPGREVRDLLQSTLAAGGNVESIVPRRVSLEEVYLDTTRREVEAHDTRPLAPVGSGGAR
ncbi:MAG: ABC transporter ATP-binding protein [Candidatus Latescibacterota bacterium]|nr:MAG: ABC transporter ATP-binding protein [Candidatus Latescibacterota bacterium]